MDIEMPKIGDCSVLGCAFNHDSTCHAIAITIGNEAPVCETSTVMTDKAGRKDIVGGVGACRMRDCVYNDSLLCTAGSVKIEKRGGHAECATFKQRATM